MMEECEEVVGSDFTDPWMETNAITRISKKMHRIKWKIENFSEFESNEKIPGPKVHFTPSECACITFEKGDNQLFVYVINEFDSKIQMKRKLILLDCNDKKLHEENDEEIFTSVKGEETDILNSVKDKDGFDALPNDTLIIDLSLSVRDKITEVHHKRFVINSHQKLIDDFKTMQENSVNSDVSLHVGNERIPAHWAVLCSRSPYFQKMFDNEMPVGERVQNSITVTDMSFDILKKVIYFLYTSEFVEDDEDDLVQLFGLHYAASKYEVMDMRALCVSKIMSKATADNVCQIFQVAICHNDKNLKTQALDFIQFNWHAVSKTEDWKKFEESAPLFAELFSFGLKESKFVN